MSTMGDGLVKETSKTSRVPASASGWRVFFSKCYDNLSGGPAKRMAEKLERENFIFRNLWKIASVFPEEKWLLGVVDEKGNHNSRTEDAAEAARRLSFMEETLGRIFDLSKEKGYDPKSLLDAVQEIVTIEIPIKPELLCKEMQPKWKQLTKEEFVEAVEGVKEIFDLGGNDKSDLQNLLDATRVALADEKPIMQTQITKEKLVEAAKEVVLIDEESAIV